MTPEDFFRDSELDSLGARVLRDDLLDRIRYTANAERSDVETGVALLRLAHDELEAYGTHGSVRTSERQILLILRTCRTLLQRLGISLDLPFSDFSAFQSHWNANGCHGSWQARRSLLYGLFEPIHRQLEQLEDDEISSALVQPVASHQETGWPQVDREINELRRHFQIAQSEQDYRNIGNDCVAALERLSGVVFDPTLHLSEGEEEPPTTHTKKRIDRFLTHTASGQGDKEIRKVARSVVDLAQALKHRDTPTRRDAGITADSVILLTTILRRLAST